MLFVKFILLLVLSASSAAPTPDLTLASTGFKNGGALPHDYSYSDSGCTGRNISPVLMWNGAPEGTQSFALTVFDPDARGGVGWWHWVVYNIPAAVNHLPKGAGSGSGDLMPQQAVQGRNDFQTIGYAGPCPPPGPAHHYHFTIYALDAELSGLSPLTSGPTLVKAMRGHVLAKAELVGVFQR